MHANTYRMTLASKINNQYWSIKRFFTFFLKTARLDNFRGSSIEFQVLRR